ncbi:MAG TPA: response regulator [Terriglobales bacterium]|nr:response regulator [Terriglobales bacterium]
MHGSHQPLIYSDTPNVLISFQPPPYWCAADREGSPPRPPRKSKNGPGEARTAGNRVLLIGRFRELALYRAEVLSGHGFRVFTPQTLEEAVRVIRSKAFDVAVLSYTLSSEIVEQLAQLIREYCPSSPLIAISETQRLDRRINPDETVIADEGPAALIAALRRVTRKQ